MRVYVRYAFEVEGADRLFHWCRNCPNYPDIWRGEVAEVKNEENTRYWGTCPVCLKLEREGECKES